MQIHITYMYLHCSTRHKSVDETGSKKDMTSTAQQVKDVWHQYTTKPSPAPLNLHQYKTITDFLLANSNDGYVIMSCSGTIDTFAIGKFNDVRIEK